MSEVAPLAVDLVPWLTTDHREVSPCSHMLVTADSSMVSCELPATIGVETQPPAPAIPTHTTFGDDGEAVCQ